MDFSRMEEVILKDFPAGPLDSYRRQATFDWKKLKFFYEEPELLKIKMHVWRILENDPAFERPIIGPSTEEMKRRTAIQLRKYCEFNFVTPETAKLSYRKKTRHLMTCNEALAATFPSVSVKYAIGLSLFKNALTTLGTERHQHVLDAAWSGKILACLALTEIAHGSNTKQMRTTATYDPLTRQFVINTPDFEAAKCWVGNLGKTCTLALLFAQLYTKGQCHGLHAFIVPIRDPKSLVPYPGIIVGDMGEKIGLHGIDNGFILFKEYRIPRENLLNRTGDVTPEGDYESSFSEPGKILGAALENLSTGRVGIMQESVNNLINAVTIAIRYAAVRKQFSQNIDDNQEEVPIIEYQLHQWRLFPYVASASVLKVFVSSFTRDYLAAVEKSTSSTKLDDLTNVVSEIHAIVSSAKPLITWTTRDAVQECREACGGHGFLKAARLGDLRETNDPCVTYEGDNNVLGQQASNWLLRQWEKYVLHGEEPSAPFGTCSFITRHTELLNVTMTALSLGDILNFNFITTCYEWLIVYLMRDTSNKQRELINVGKNRTEARNETQVYRSAILSRVYAEFNAINHYKREMERGDVTLRPVLDQLGILYSLNCIERHSVYFYEGGLFQSPELASLIKEGVLVMCQRIKANVLGVVDAMAPPDFVLNSVLGNSNGLLYENLQTALLHSPGAMSRPDWWREIVVPDAPDFTQPPKSKL